MISLTGQSRRVKHPQKGQDQRQVLVDQVIDSHFDTGLSISFEVGSSFWKVDVSLLSERRRREPPRGVWGREF